MQGSGQSSLSIWTAYDTHTTASVRNPVHDLKVAWTRVKDDSLSFATVDTSLVGGTDIVQGQLSAITEPDKFKYYDEDERVVSMSFERVVEEPLGGLSYALGDATLDNTTHRFTWGVSDTIGTALKPRRPIKMFMGFTVKDEDKKIPVLYGLTDKLIEDKQSRRFTTTIFDYLGYINDYELGEVAIYTDQRSDQIIADILSTIGFTAAQYDLDEGLNTIGFAWFDKGTKAGSAIRKICEAEEAHFYQDEQGKLRFETRRAYLDAPLNATQWTINDEDILNHQQDASVPVINHVIVKAKPRTVQSASEIWRLGFAEEIEPGDTKEIWATFQDPVTDITAIASTTDYIANTKQDGTGSDITSDVSVVVTEFATAAKIEITNNYGGKAYMTTLRLRGTPAVIDSEIEEVYADTDSEENYGRQQLTITNDFIDSESFAYYLARAIVKKYSSPLKRIKVTVPALPHLQLKDKVVVVDKDTGSKNSYRVMKIRTKMGAGIYMQQLTLREITDDESDCAAVVDTATVDGECVVWQ